MLEANLIGVVVQLSGTPAGEHRVTAGWLCPEKGYYSLSSLPLTQPGHSAHGTCLRMFCFLGNGTLTYRVIWTDDGVCFDC